MSAKSHLSRVHECRCVVCLWMSIIQRTPTTAHHVESVRDEISHYASAAICWDHHQGPNGIHGLSRRAFEMRYRLSPLDLVALTLKEMDHHGLFVH